MYGHVCLDIYGHVYEHVYGHGYGHVYGPVYGNGYGYVHGPVCGPVCRCDFEFAISLRENGVEYKCDVITALRHRLDYRGARAAVAITDGLVAADEEHVTAKTERESFFPDSLLQAALSIQLQNGEASYESGRNHRPDFRKADFQKE